MANRFSSGRHAFGFCDRCGFRFALAELQPQVVKQKLTGLRVCPVCIDIDHEQLMLGTFPVDDPQAIRDARPTGGIDGRDLVDQQPLSVLFIPPTP